MTYVSKLMIIYGLAFFLSYYGMGILYKLKRISKVYHMILAGLIMGCVQSLITVLVKGASLTGIPDARFLTIGFTTFAYGPISGIIAAIMSSGIIHLLNRTVLWSLLIIQLLNIGIYSLGYYIIQKRRRKPNNTEIFLFVAVSSSVVIPLASILAKQNTPYLESLHNLHYLILLAGFMDCALMHVLYRDKERDQYIRDLKERSTELTNYQERVEFLAYHDSQTGFYNREKLFDRLRKRKQETQQPLGVMLLISIHESEKIEGTLGNVLMETLCYLVGIEIMSRFETLSEGQMYSIDQDRYVILVNQKHSVEETEACFRSLYERFMSSIKINTIEMRINLIAGGVAFAEQVFEPEQWVEQCEFALFEAGNKKANAQIIWFDQMLMERHTLGVKMEHDLYSAIEKQELYLMYQPQYDQEGKLRSAEALLRWRHPTLGEIPPGIFIPIAEKNGLIDDIGKKVLAFTCQFVKVNQQLFNQSDHKFPIAINASFLELINPNFIHRFMEILDSYQVTPEQIRVEVTESEVSLHYNELFHNLNSLSMLGIGVELDDFGTGYSSLSHLGTMPVQTIKIDKTFIDRILSDEKIADLVEMIIDFTHRFRMKVVAEGVETLEQFEWLRNKKCDIYQGYYFSKPLVEEQFLLQVSEKWNPLK